MCSMIRFAGIPKEFLDSNTAMDLLFSIINDENYMFCTYDTYYVPCGSPYIYMHFPQMVLIYGYDKENQVF